MLFQRVSKGEIGFKRVLVIFDRQALERVIYRLLLHEGCNYYIRHYEALAKAIPMVNVLSFDDETFYLSADYPKEMARQLQFLRIREPKLADLFKSYWNNLWSQAIPLNEGGFIDWEELERIGLKMGMTKDEFESMVSKMKDRVQQDKRRIRRW